MTVDAKFEALYSQIELVRGAGDRRRAQLCIMSFVAFLAGLDHSDNPAPASPLVRRFAITVNDEMPKPQRQSLKPFAPLIIGTRDGRDGERANLLIAAARSELLPRVEAELSGAQFTAPRSHIRPWPAIYEHVTTLVFNAEIPRDAKGCEEVGFAVARLICCLGQIAPLPQQRAWFWTKAVDLLDRLCAVGANRERPAISLEHLDTMAAFLERRHSRGLHRSRSIGAWARVCELIPALVR